MTIKLPQKKSAGDTRVQIAESNAVSLGWNRVSACSDGRTTRLEFVKMSERGSISYETSKLGVHRNIIVTNIH